VGVLPDGRVYSAGRAPDRIEFREVDDGRTLWTLPADPALGFTVLAGGWSVSTARIAGTSSTQPPGASYWNGLTPPDFRVQERFHRWPRN